MPIASQTSKRRLLDLPPLALAMVAWLWALAPLAAGDLWIADLLANLVAWSGLAAFAAGAWLAARKRVLLAVIALVPMLATGLWLAPPRAARSAPSAQSMRVLQINALTKRATPDEIMQLLQSCDADVVAITEAPRPLLDAVRGDPILRSAFPYRDLPPWDLTHTRLVLSRWPLEPLIERPSLPPGDPRRALRLARVLHERGEFVVLSLHPRSPRTPGRWREGNQLVRLAVEVAREAAAGEPIIVLADLNATPPGYRSRLLERSLGVRRCKPLTALAGTYPASLPWPLSLPVDDAWVSEDWRVSAWRTIGGLGSDHRAVEVTLVRSAP